jgi:hypothetical protein
MGEHLSALALDEVAAGTANPQAQAHLRECGDCRRRLEAITSAASAISAMPAFEARLRDLESTLPAAPPSRWRRVAFVAVPLAAALVLLVMLGRPEDGTRLKGAPTVELLLEGQPVAQAREGARLDLAVGGAGATHAVILGVEASGDVVPLWPEGDVAAPIEPGARSLVGKRFVVTAGDLLVVAFFSTKAQPIAPLRDAVQKAAAGGAPSTLELPTGFGATAQLRLSVTP